MKIPFDLKTAKAGGKIVTRNGTSARIICYDRNSSYPIVALVRYDKYEEVITYTSEGTRYHDYPDNLDLFLEDGRTDGFDLEEAIKYGCKTRNGLSVKILQNFRTGSEIYPIAGIINFGDYDKLHIFTENGRYFVEVENHELDLVNSELWENKLK